MKVGIIDQCYYFLLNTFGRIHNFQVVLLPFNSTCTRPFSCSPTFLPFPVFSCTFSLLRNIYPFPVFSCTFPLLRSMYPFLRLLSVSSPLSVYSPFTFFFFFFSFFRTSLLSDLFRYNYMVHSFLHGKWNILTLIGIIFFPWFLLLSPNFSHLKRCV